MKTLATSNSIIGNNAAPSSFSASLLKERLLCGGPEFVSYRRHRKLTSSGLQHLVSLRRGGIEFLPCFSSHQQADTQNEVVENQDTNQSKTVRVKFQLQKECTFGEHFFVVGDDPSFGSWDVTSAIPLNWADGHLWAAEVEIPVGKAIQFKFVLQGETGNVVWQPGPDRTFQPWETSNTIIVSEDWDSAESRILGEEENIINQDEHSPVVSEKLMIEDSLFALADASIVEKSSVESHEVMILGDNISASEENGSNVSASEENTKDIMVSNIISPKESYILNTSNKAVSEVYSNPNGETTIISQSETKRPEEVLENYEKEVTAKIPRNADVQESFINYGVPVLVPGLPPTPTTSNQDAPQHEVEDDGSIDGINESNDHKLPENIQDPDVVVELEMEVKSSYEENVVQSEIRQEDDTNKIANESDLQEVNGSIVRNDITWGHKTLKKFFSSLRLL
ncbi:uncharacterized protein LOC111482035 [Cucurbita maxima]|uniref:Uncharacterized protein LOC111482035 n=1 Tax=Cucurbita maxima TaxID=3661 RepID=A0A6J1J7C1_CUCMA|nr:uncharacterized protein LOC111482035 [Cucurbita maxima]